MGTVVLQGGGPFVANDELDRRLLVGLGGPVAVLPTAEAFENPEVIKASARAWAERLGISMVMCDVYTRADAREVHHARAVESSAAVVLVGDSSIHLRSTLLNTAVWEAICAQSESGMVIGVGSCAAALCDPMIDQRGGAFGLGLGLVPGVSVLAESEKVPHDQLQRTSQLAGVPFIEVPTGSAVIVRDGKWTSVGDVVVHGELTVVSSR